MHINKRNLELAMGKKAVDFTKLAELSKVSRTTLSYINNGKSCRPIVAGKIAAALDVEISDLIEDEKEA